MSDEIVGAIHEFHDPDYVHDWSERFVPTPERLQLFDTILSQLRDSVPENGRVLELGIGPGYLARFLLEAMPGIEYHGIDFSTPMLEIAAKRLDEFSSRITYTQTDLVIDPWEGVFSLPLDAIVSTWTLHDLGSQENVELVYRKSFKALAKNGALLNGDFIKPVGTPHEFEAGRFEIDRHLAMLKEAGYTTAECLLLLEEEINSPTSAQNYACMMAKKE